MGMLDAIAATTHQTQSTLATPIDINFANPVVIASIASLLTVLITKGIDLWVAHRKSRDDFRHSDRELLSADEKDFRLTIIKQLQACHDANAVKDKEIFRFQTENIVLASRVATLELELKKIKAKVNRVAEETVEAVQQAADEVTNPKEKK